MAKKIKFQGKTYTLLAVEDVVDPSIVKFRGIVKDSLGKMYTYISSVTGHFLYDNKGQRVAETYSVQKWDT